MVLIETNIFQKNITLDMDEVTEGFLLLSRIEIYCQIVSENVVCKNTTYF